MDREIKGAVEAFKYPPGNPQGALKQPKVTHLIPDTRRRPPRGAPEAPKPLRCAETMELLHFFFIVAIVILTTVAHLRGPEIYKLPTLQAFCLIFMRP